MTTIYAAASGATKNMMPVASVRTPSANDALPAAFPSLIHATPHHFGADKSQAVIGVQMASAYIGTCALPPLFGFIADRFGISLLPVYVLLFCLLMIASHERLVRLTKSVNGIQ